MEYEECAFEKRAWDDAGDSLASVGADGSTSPDSTAPPLGAGDAVLAAPAEHDWGIPRQHIFGVIVGAYCFAL